MLEPAFDSDTCIISVMGDHAGEDTAKIFARKQDDISKIGFTFWLTRSYKSKPNLIATIDDKCPLFVIFIAPSKTGGSRPTTVSDTATQFMRPDGVWTNLPIGLGPVTGKLGKASYAFVFDYLELIKGREIDMWAYAELENPEMPINPKLGCSTICAIRRDMLHSSGKLSKQYRKVIAVGRLTGDRCVWVH
jgi:hypothetical protein